MSYDINFWKQSKPLELTPEEIYHKLCQGERVEGLETLPIPQILSRIERAFPDHEKEAQEMFVELENCGLEFSWSDQHIRCDIRGEQCARVNDLVAIMREFGCPMYDPQVNERYDANGGMVVADSPPFTDWTDDQRQTFERQREILLAGIGESVPKRGCRKTAALILALGVVAVWLCARALMAG